VHLSLAHVERERAPYTQSTEFGRHTEKIDPEPSSKDIYNVFEKKTVYRFTVTSLPGFLEYDEKTQEPCLRLPPYSDLTEADIVSAVKKRSRGRYRMEIALTSDVVPVAVHQGTYLTSREYDLQPMYQTIVKEGNRRCGP
jgi:hypothetical protein